MKKFKKPESTGRRFDPVEHNPRYAALGNGANTPLPIVDPWTGEEMSSYDTKARDEFIARYPRQAGQLATFVNRIKNLTGIGRLRDLPTVASLDERTNKGLIDQTRERILITLGFLKKFVPEKRDYGLREMGRKSDDGIHEIIKDFFPDYEHHLSLKNEVMTCNDAAKLLFMAFDDTLDPRTRYEARRKLLLMELIGEHEDYSTDDENHEDALGDMMEFMNDQMISVPKGQKRTAAVKRYLVSKHSKDKEHKTISATMQQDKPGRVKALERVTPIATRIAPVENQRGGNKREIHFYTIPREKSTLARLMKALRYGAEVGERDTDRNGIRMVFACREDWDDFFRLFKERLQNNIKTQLEHNIRMQESYFGVMAQLKEQGESVKVQGGMQTDTNPDQESTEKLKKL
ncbi:hypothetical protein KKF73_07210 [Patescibacteria group bacterium]|nr:hypothetical protein [Patescibacteria group bacterium]